MSDSTVDVEAVESLARRATEVDLEQYHVGATSEAGIPPLMVIPRRTDEVIDVLNFEGFADHPPRATGDAEFYDHQTFAEYVHARSTLATTLWAEEDRRVVTAVFNDHQLDLPGWRDHTATLGLDLDDVWVEWRTGRSGLEAQRVVQHGGFPKQVMLDHKDFAEFIEEHAQDIYKPDRDKGGLPNSTVMLGVARNFQVKTNSHTRTTRAVRTDSDTVSIHYEPRDDAKGGAKGEIEIPTEFLILIPIFKRGPKIVVRALFRWKEDRNTGDLQLGYKLVRPDDEQRAAFDASLAEIRNVLEGRVLTDSEGAASVDPADRAVINFGSPPRKIESGSQQPHRRRGPEAPF